MTDKTHIVCALCNGVPCFYTQEAKPGERSWTARRNRATLYTERAARVLAYALAATVNRGIPDSTIHTEKAYE